MKIVYAFYKVNGPHAKWEDKLIAWWTKGKYSHVEIFIPETMKRYTSSGRVGGVVKRDIKSLNGYKTGIDDVWDYIEVEVPDDVVFKIEEFYNMTKDDKYDWMAIFGFILPFRDRNNQWICSEWCSNFGKISNIKILWNLDPAELSPNKLYDVLKGYKDAKVIN